MLGRLGDSEDILHHAVRTLVRRERWVQRRELVLHGLFIGVCLWLALAIWYRFSPMPIGRLATFGLACFVLPMLGALVLSLWGRVEPLTLLIRADRALKLQERLSTAYELLKSSTLHPFRPVLVQEAARAARSLNPYRVIPTHTPPALRWTPFLLLASVLVLVVDLGMLIPASFIAGDEGPRAALQEKGQKLERLGKRLEAEARRRGLERSLEAARRMQSLGLRLQNEKVNEREAIARVSSLSDYVRNLEEELKKMAVLEDVNIGRVREIMISQASVANEVQRLLGMVARGKLSAGEMRTLQERMQSLGQQGVFDERLSDVLGQLREGNLEGARELLENFLLQDQLAQDFEQLRRAERALERGFDLEGSEDERMAFDGPAGEPGDYGDDEMGGDQTASSGGIPGDLEGGDFLDSEGAGSNSSIGSGRGTERESGRSRPPEASSPASKISGISGEGGVRRAYVRALPLKGDASVPLEEVVVTYRRRAEESLLREEIPLGSRELVKAYFLSIGLVDEAAGSDAKDEQRER
ncbi:MAG: hypothetical protein HYZ81_14075 [Nitrospinae bacterium]|nr:hypothetical protein [Nitrospinota bacterium]